MYVYTICMQLCMLIYQFLISIGAVAVSIRAYDPTAIADPWNNAVLLTNVQLLKNNVKLK